MIITILIDNQSINHLHKEHGLSMFIEHNKHTYLLDAGQSHQFIDNAKALSINLNSDYTILSHGHYDHSNGFIHLDHQIYASKHIFEDYYSTSHDHLHYIGLSKQLKKESFHLIEENIKLNDDAYLIQNKHTSLNKNLFVFKDQLIHDDFHHELSLVLKTNDGLVVFNSCSHGGFIHIVENIKNIFDMPVIAYIGGLHLKGYKEQQEICTLNTKELNDLCDYIIKENIKVYTGHCTGHVSYQILKEYLKDHIEEIYSGKQIKI